MSSNHSLLLSLKLDRRAIRLADGRVLYSEGLSSIRFLSSCGYYIVINNVLSVPGLASNRFAFNRFARERRNDHIDDHIEILEFSLRLWVNRRATPGLRDSTSRRQFNRMTSLRSGSSRSVS